MRQLLKGFNSLSLLGPVLAILFLLDFSQTVITASLSIISFFYFYKRSYLAGSVVLVLVFFLSQGIKTPALFYPVLVNLIVFSVFFASLFSKKCLIQRFAEKMENELPEHAISYCYNVNIIWTVFLGINTFISYLTTKNIKLWSWYNGLISYLLIALLFFCEYIFRQYYRKRK